MTIKLITALEKDISKANIAYRTGEPVDISELSDEAQIFLNKKSGSLSDKEYDSMIEKLKELNPESEIFTSGVIEKPDELNISEERKQKLDFPMYSLNKETNVDKIKKWLKNKNITSNINLVITPKYDGISILRNEKTTKSFSRGDGIYGEDITEHYKSLNSFVTKKVSKEIYTIGELIIPRKKFDVNKHLFIRDNGEVYKNPRNMVAGLKNMDSVSQYWKYVDHIRYGLADEGYKYNKTEQFDIIEKETGYKIIHEIITSSEITDEKLDELYYKWSEVYEIDGLVIDIEDKNIRKQLGRETNNNPAYARAYKTNWVNPIKTPVLFNEWNVSKEGYVKPVVLVKPFEIEGVTVSKATGYNAKFIKDNNIGKGSIVEVIRSGSVIPKIVNVSKSTHADIPLNCPSCGMNLIWNKSGVEIVCTNKKCETKNIKKIAFFFSTLGVEDFGQQIVSKFYKNEYDTIGKILKMSIQDIANIEGMGVKSANKILSQFETKVKEARFEMIGHASGCFENIGSRKLKMIIDGLGGIEKFKAFQEKYLQEGINQNIINKLNNIKGVGEITSYAFLKGVDCFKEFSEEMGIEIKENSKNTSNITFKGRVFVFSGVRDKELQQFIIDNDGEVKTSVSKNTTDVLVKDINSTSSKVAKARELGCNIITVENFKNTL